MIISNFKALKENKADTDILAFFIFLRNYKISDVSTLEIKSANKNSVTIEGDEPTLKAVERAVNSPKGNRFNYKNGVVSLIKKKVSARNQKTKSAAVVDSTTVNVNDNNTVKKEESTED